MSTALKFRKARLQDIPAILKLYEQPEIDDGASLSVDKAAEIFSRMEQYPAYAIYVAVLDGLIVGSFALLIMDNLGHLGAPSAIVEDVAVAPDFQHRGVGKKMMHRAISYAESSGCYKITLSANFKRQIAHKFYESLGFEKHGYSFKMPMGPVKKTK